MQQQNILVAQSDDIAPSIHTLGSMVSNEEGPKWVSPATAEEANSIFII